MIFKENNYGKNTVTQTKNTPPVRLGAMIVSLLIQLAAFVVVGSVSLHYGMIGILIALSLAAGYVLLVLKTLKLIQNKISDESSTLTIIHVIASVVGVFIIAGFMTMFTNLPF